MAESPRPTGVASALNVAPADAMTQAAERVLSTYSHILDIDEEARHACCDTAVYTLWYAILYNFNRFVCEPGEPIITVPPFAFGDLDIDESRRLIDRVNRYAAFADMDQLATFTHEIAKVYDHTARRVREPLVVWHALEDAPNFEAMWDVLEQSQAIISDDTANIGWAYLSATIRLFARLYRQAAVDESAADESAANKIATQ